MTENTDPYLYPGTDVLKNRRNICAAEILAQFEAEATSRRLVQLINSPMPGRFDTAHLQAIHQHIFQDVYVWAGQFRIVNISKDGHLFGAAAFIEPTLDGLLRQLYAENYLRGADADAFAKRAGLYLGEINAVHPFREGNGRTQREFIRELALDVGFTIDWSRIQRDRMTAASRLSFQTGDNSGLAALILTSMA